MSRRPASREARVTADVRALVALDLEGLRAEWRRRIGPPPKLRSPELLAWRIQVEAFGGLDDHTAAVVQGRCEPKPRRAEAPRGARLTREWQGRAHTVERVEGGYLYDGRLRSSLSEIAREITGVRAGTDRASSAYGEEARARA